MNIIYSNRLFVLTNVCVYKIVSLLFNVVEFTRCHIAKTS